MCKALFDLDSLLYHSVYQIVEFKDLVTAYRGADRIIKRDGLHNWETGDLTNDLLSAIVQYANMSEFDRLMWSVATFAKRRNIVIQYVVEEALARLNKKILHIYEHVEKSGVKLSSYELYVTQCKRSVRKQIYPLYKANRKKEPLRKYINALRYYLIDEGNVIYDDEFEADDLIADRAKELKALGHDYIILSLDKDLKQIPGKHFDYYAIKAVNPETGEKMFVHYKGLTFTSNFDSYEMIAIQMLMGDSTDNIIGLKGVGPKNAERILSGVTKPKQFIKIVYREYINHWSIKDHKKEFMTNLRLVKLGRSLKIE